MQSIRKWGRTLIMIGTLVLILALSLSGCAGLGFADDPPEFGYRLDVPYDAHVVFGANEGPYSVDQGYPDFRSVGAIYDLIDDTVSSSGVLIGDRWVLTAGHCVLSTDEDGEEVRYNPGDLVFRFGPDGDQPEQEFIIKAIHIHPEWESLYADAGDEKGFDLAILELQNPVEGIPVQRIYEGNDEPLGSRVIGVGYGYHELLNEYDPDFDWSLRRAWENILDRKVDLGPGAGILSYDFDSPDGSSLTYGVSNTLAETFEPDDEEMIRFHSILGEGDSDPTPLGLEGTSVPGDSGGPMFIQVDGEWVVGGVVSFGSTIGYYGDVAFYTRVSSHTDWIRSVLGR